MKKAKWLEEATQGQLLEMLKEIVSGDMDDKEARKAQKIVDELIERNPQASEEVSVTEALAQLTANFEAGVAAIQAAYDQEVEAVDGEEDEVEVDDDSDDEEEDDLSGKTLKELKKLAKAAGIKVKGLSKEDIIAELQTDDSDDVEDETEPEDDDEEEVDYSDWAIKSLKVECRTRGLKVTRSMKKSDLIKALEADDKE